MQRLGAFFARLAGRYLPDAMVIACGLTLLMLGAAWIAAPSGELAALSIGRRGPAVLRLWFNGIWHAGFLAFALQMCLVLLTGYGLAHAPPALAAMRRLTARVSTGRGAVLAVAATSCIGCWINWGFGLIAAGVLATELRRELSRRGVPCNFALVVAAAYSGMMIWHGGLSGSAPLKMAESGIVIVRSTAGGGEVTLPPLSIEHTVLSPGNLILTALFLVGIPVVLARMAGRRSSPNPLAGHVDASLAGVAPPHEDERLGLQAAEPGVSDASPAARLGRSAVVSRSFGVLILAALVTRLASGGGVSSIDLNVVIALFLAAGLLLHDSLASYLDAVGAGGRAVTGIILQFPLYAGIQGVMVGSGIGEAVSRGFVEGAQGLSEAIGLSPGHAFSAAVFLSAGVVNLFVPSGGGQWILQGSIMCSAADALALPIGPTVMAVSYGDQWTNMIQPFWAIPLMGLTGVNVREFMGYCALLMLLAMPVFLIALMVMFAGG